VLEGKEESVPIPTASETRQGCTEYSLTREFIQDQVLEELSAYDGKPEDVVLRAALEDKFSLPRTKAALSLHGRDSQAICPKESGATAYLARWIT